MSAIIDTIANLLNKTVANGCTLEECEAAGKAAQKLMTKHRITTAMLEVEGTSEAGSAEINNLTSVYEGKRVVHWKSGLCQALSEVNGCSMYYNNINTRNPVTGRAGKVVNYKVIGTEEDAAIVSKMFAYLCAAVEGACKQAMKLGYGSGKDWSNSFKMGAVAGLRVRLIEANKEAREEIEASQSSALMVLDQRKDAVEKWTSQKLKLSTSNTRGRSTNGNAYGMGLAASKRINLSGNVLS